LSRLLIFGYGFIGKAFAAEARSAGHTVTAAIRTPKRYLELDLAHIDGVLIGDLSALSEAVQTADGILVTAPPDDNGCPIFAVTRDLLTDTAPKWIGYLSTTGVYGDRDGGWVWEDSPLQPTSAEGRRRVLAEQQWQTLTSHRLNIFRLPGLYGPGRNVIERLRDGTARNIVKPGHVFSRLHHDDCASALLAAFESQAPRHFKQGIFNLCDDMPASAADVLAYAAQLTGLSMPAPVAWDDPSLSPGVRRFYQDNKRVSNARAKAVFGWRPQYPTYHEGLNSLWVAIQSGKSV
jgi:nucleoside-diphosphate-sugar epimerase